MDDANPEYRGGVVIYDFVNDVPSAEGIKSLVEVADIKTDIDAIKLSRAKNTITLPTLVSSVTYKDGSGTTTEYVENY